MSRDLPACCQNEGIAEASMLNGADFCDTALRRRANIKEIVIDPEARAVAQPMRITDKALLSGRLKGRFSQKGTGVLRVSCPG